jgi:methylated-DNA-protein-cysteine methyltransferase related protein
MTPGFTSPPDPQAYKAIVWEIVRQIPPGKVSTYGQIAAMIPPPGEMNLRDYSAFGARWVGGAMAGCPVDVPWQRVINAQGKVSLPKGKGYERQVQLLQEEGVVMDSRERVDLSQFGWQGPPAAWLNERGLQPPPSLGRR